MIRRPPRSTRTDTLFPTRRSSDLPILARSALDDVDRQAPARGFLVFVLHVAAGVAHGLDDLVQAHLVLRSEEHTSELQSLMRISYAVFCLKKKNKNNNTLPKYTNSILYIHMTKN